MTTEKIYEELTSVFREVFQDENLHIDAGTTAEDVNGWDSTANVTLILAIEMKFGVLFHTGEVDEMQRVGDLVDAIERKLTRH
jgi:acyl carrier protein